MGPKAAKADTPETPETPAEESAKVQRKITQETLLRFEAHRHEQDYRPNPVFIKAGQVEAFGPAHFYLLNPKNPDQPPVSLVNLYTKGGHTFSVRATVEQIEGILSRVG